MEDYILLLRSQILVRHVYPDPHGLADINHKAPHQGVPRCDRSLLDSQVLIRDQCGLVHCTDHSRTAAAATGSLAVEGQLLSSGTIEPGPALGAFQFLLQGDRHGRRQIMAVGAAVACKTGEHQSKAVQQLGGSSECTADARDSGPLMKGERRRDVPDLIDLCPGRLGHAPARICRKGLQVPARTFGVQHSQRK